MELTYKQESFISDNHRYEEKKLLGEVYSDIPEEYEDRIPEEYEDWINDLEERMKKEL